MNINSVTTNNIPAFVPTRDIRDQKVTSSDWKEKIKTVPVIGHLIRAIIWLFKKIFPCCFSKPTPIPQIVSLPKKATLIENPPQKSMIEKVLDLPKELRSEVIESLSQKDLTAFDVALSSQKSSEINFKNLQESVKQNLQKVTLENACEDILKRNPTWRLAVESWTTISLEDKLWLLRLHELNLYEQIPAIIFPIPCNDSTNLISQKQVERDLARVKVLHMSGKSLTTCPDFFCLLPNLQTLYIHDNQLTAAPDVSKNINLIRLDLSNNKITVPPNLKNNKNLKELGLAKNLLTISPDLSHNDKLRFLSLAGNRITTIPNNTRLEGLSLADNQLTVPPDLSQFKNLKMLHLANNQLTKSPDFSHNIALEQIKLNKNLITIPPDVSSLFNLKGLDLRSNRLSDSPDMTHNEELEQLFLSNNQLTVPPNVSQNKNLQELYLGRNQLTQAPKVDQNRELKELKLGNNKITQLPKVSKNLENLELQNNPLTAAAMAEVKRLERKMKYLDIRLD